ncbi:MAG: serine/threonine-protein kinase [Planctomycetota bacterium]
MSGAGLDLGSGDYQVEANAYLRQRLQLAYVFVSTVAVTFLLMDFVTGWMAPAKHYPHAPARIVHILGVVMLLFNYVLLRKRPYPERTLALFDAALVLGGTFTCLGIYAVAMETPGARRLLWIVSLLVVARGVAVPSTVRRTFLLSMSAPITLLVVRRILPLDEAAPGVQLMWDTLVMMLAVAVATFATRVNYRLRREVRTARKLGQYQIEEKLGEGAMGTVYRATHHMLRRPTAVKLLRPELAGEETIARFETEVRHTAQLQHPNTIAIYDYGRTADGVFYYAMELLDGDDLEVVLRESGPMPSERVVHVLRQVCASLHEAHEQGLVHRDVKLGNIVLCRRAGMHDVAKVLDFGLVKDLRNSGIAVTQVGMLCGTPETIAPEVLAGESSSPRSDLYSLGVVGYQLLTGRLPFEVGSPAELIGAHLHSEPATADGPLGALLACCMAKSPTQRPQSADELRSALGECLAETAWTEESAAQWWSHYRVP